MSRTAPLLVLAMLSACSLHLQPGVDPAVAVNRGLAPAIRIGPATDTVTVPVTYPARLVIDSLRLQATRNEVVPVPARYLWQRAPRPSETQRPPVRVEDVFLVRALAAAAVHDPDDTDLSYAAAIDALRDLSDDDFAARIDAAVVGCALDALQVEWPTRPLPPPPDYRAGDFKKIVQLATQTAPRARRTARLSTRLPRAGLPGDASFPACSDAASFVTTVYGAANPAFSNESLTVRDAARYRRYADATAAEDALVDVQVEFPVRIAGSSQDTWVVAASTVADLERAQGCTIDRVLREARFLPQLADDERRRAVSNGRFTIRFRDGGCRFASSIFLPVAAKEDTMLAPGDVVRLAEAGCLPRPATVVQPTEDRRP